MLFFESCVLAGAEVTAGGVVPFLHLVVLDGTWTQAKKMEKQAPRHLVRVSVPVEDHSATLATALRKVALPPPPTPCPG